MRLITIILLALFMNFPVLAEIKPYEQLSDPVLQERATALYNNLRCVVCPGQSIADSNADIAADLRALVREKLIEGQDDSDILAYIQTRYGDKILMKPPLKPETWLLWAMPTLIFMIGAFMASRMIGGGKKS